MEGGRTREAQMSNVHMILKGGEIQASQTGKKKKSALQGHILPATASVIVAHGL